MPSLKPTYKRPREKINSFSESTWLSNDKPFFENHHTAVFHDYFPCTEGHKLFVPKENTAHHVGESMKLAYWYGEQRMKEGKIEGFNVGMNVGECAGQTIFWPHIHFIPRHSGDSPHPGGIRHAHPGADHEEKY